MITLGILMMILGIICVPVAAWALHSLKKIWPAIFLSVLACILIVAGALGIGMAQLEHMNSSTTPETYYSCPYCGEELMKGA